MRHLVKKIRQMCRTVNDVLIDPYPFIILVDPHPFRAINGYGSTEMIKGYGSTKTSLTVHAVCSLLAKNCLLRNGVLIRNYIFYI